MVKAGREARKTRKVKSGHKFAQGAWAILEALKSGLDISVNIK